jgi:hypothetical protein
MMSAFGPKETYRGRVSMHAKDQRRRVILWFVPVVILLHAVEQSVTIRQTLDAARTGMPRALRVMIPPVSAEQYMIACAVVVLAAFGVALLGRIESPRGFGPYALVAMTAALFCNACARAIASIVLDRYTSGLLTAVVVVVPFSVFLFWVSIRERWFPAGVLTLLVSVGLIFHIPIFFGVLFFSGFIARWLARLA